MYIYGRIQQKKWEERKMKNKCTKMLSLVICMILLATSLGTVPVFAAEDIPHVISPVNQTNIEAECYSTVKTKNLKGYTRDYNSGGRYPNNTCISLGSETKSLTYYVDVQETGKYELAMYYTGGGQCVWNYGVDDVMLGEADCKSTETGINKYFIANLDLTKGTHYININNMVRNALGQYTFFYYLSLKPVGSGGSFAKDSGSFKETQIPCIIQGEDFDLGAAGSKRAGDAKESEYRADSKMAIEKDSSGSFYLSLEAGDYANYSFVSNVSDYYTISANAMGDAHFKLILDGKELPISGRSKNEIKFEEVKLSTAYIEAGNHTLQVQTADKELAVDYLRIYSGKDIADNTVIIEENDAGTLNNVYKTFYVSTAGNDETGDGSKAAPFATIKRAKEEVAKVNNDMTGDIIVYVQPGEYKLEETEVFKPEHGGKNGYNVIFKGTDILNPPLISGGKRVTGWTKGENGIWSAPLTDMEYVRNLYVNELAAIRARSTYKYQFTEYYDDPATVDVKYDGYKIRRLNFPETLSRPQDMELVWNHTWETRRTPVENIIYGDKDITIKVFPQSIQGDASTTRAGQWAYLENAMELLNEPGEFYWNAGEGRIYYYPYEQEDMTTAITYVGETERLIKVEGNSAEDKVNNLIFDGLKIFYGEWFFTSKYGWMGSQSDGQGTGSRSTGFYKDQFTAQICVDYADRFVMRNCEVACNGAAGISMEFGVTNSKLEGNIFRDLSGTGIKIGAHDNQLEANKHKQNRKIDVVNNVVTRIGQEWFNNCGISVMWEKDINILHNYISETPYSGMSIGWGWEQEYQYDVGNYNISYNHVENVMEVNNDCGVIYTLGKLGNSIISNNYLRGHVRTQHGGIIYHDAGSGNVEDFNNVMLDSHYWLHVTPPSYRPKNIYFHDNWSNAEHSAADRVYDADRNIRVEEPIKVSADNLPEEAQAVADKAGLEPQYKRLQAMAALPEWHDDRHYGALMYGFESHLDEEPGIVVQAEDFIKGGEGVGTHKITPVNKVNSYREETDVDLTFFTEINSNVIGTNAGGEWQKYKLVIPEEGDFLVSVVGAQWFSGDLPNVAKLTLNGEDLPLDFFMPKKSGQARWQEITAEEPIHLEAGEYELQMTFRASFYFDKMRFLPTDEDTITLFYGNEVHYDESEFVPYDKFMLSREKQKIRDAKKAEEKK